MLVTGYRPVGLSNGGGNGKPPVVLPFGGDVNAQGDAAANHPGERFDTVVTRTQGSRIDTLRETLLCLSAQTSQNFEVCIVGHNLEVDAQLAVERVIADLHDGMRQRVRLVRVEGGTRAEPLRTREAVASETPASWATSLRRTAGIGGSFVVRRSSRR